MTKSMREVFKTSDSWCASVIAVRLPASRLEIAMVMASSLLMVMVVLFKEVSNHRDPDAVNASSC